MIPTLENDYLQQDFITETPSKTYKVNLNNYTVSGYTDGIDAMIQAIYFILNIERYEYLIYSWNYGIELQDLFGQPTFFVIAELERRIKEALLQDSRITSVDNFEFERRGKKVSCKFIAHTIFGNINAEKEISV